MVRTEAAKLASGSASILVADWVAESAVQWGDKMDDISAEPRVGLSAEMVSHWVGLKVCHTAALKADLEAALWENETVAP